MPPTEAPPAVPQTAAAPTPTETYNLSAHPPSPSGKKNPAITESLNRRAGIVQSPPVAEPKTIPSQPPKQASPAAKQETAPDAPPPAAPKGDEKPAPHVKFISADDREPEPVTPEVTNPDPSATQTQEPDSKDDTSAMRALREAHRKLKHDFSEKVALEGASKKQIADYQAKVKSYEDRIKALENAEGRAKELEKQVLTYDEQLRIANYMAHPEFHEKFVKPVADAMQEGHSMVKELIVTDANGEQRYGTESDFAEVLSQPNYALMDKKAVELFGERMSGYVVEQAKKTRSLQQNQSKAVKDAGLRSQEWLKQQSERAASERDRARTEFDRISNSLADKYPQLYRPPADDNEAVAARQSGEELARIVLDGAPDGMTQDQYLNAVAKVYHRAASFPMRELAINRLQAENDALKAKLASYEKSSPDASSRQTPSGVRQDAGGTIVTSGDALRTQMRESLTRFANKGGR